MIKKLSFLMVLTLGSMVFASNADVIAKVLASNVGLAGGQVSNNQGTCSLHVYKPGEFVPSSQTSYVEYTLDYSPAYHLVPYPNDGSILEWTVDTNKSTLVAYLENTRQNY